MCKDQKLREFLVDYNELLSLAALEHKGSFSALASPTLNKQEAITFLYRNVVNYINDQEEKITRPNPLRLHLKFIAQLCLMFLKLFKTSLQFRIRSIPKKCLYVRTWLVPMSIQNGKVRDDYFRRLIDDLSVTHNVIVGFQPHGYGETLRQFKYATKPDNFIIPVGLLNTRDLLKIFIDFVLTAKVTLKTDYLYHGKNITPIINASLTRDYFQLHSFQAYLEHAIAKKINGHQPETFLYVFENQAWENAYLTVFKDTETKTIGYQSSGISFRYLGYFPSRIDAENALFPDLILTVGEIFTRTLKEFGHYSIPIETFAALRYDHPVEDDQYTIADPVPEICNRILYAFSFHFYQYSKIIQDLIDVFENSGVQVHLKFHPTLQNHQLNIQLPKNYKILKPTNDHNLKDNYDLVLFNDTSFGLESLMEGVKSYEYDVEEDYDESRMIDFDIYDNRVNKSRLKELKDQIITKQLEKNFPKTSMLKYINKLYKSYSGIGGTGFF